MNDERYEFFQDCKDKKITARSARHKKTHTGKGGRVRLPSDNLSKKEREAMNGECKSYRMNDPISWDEFKTWPKEHQETYIKLLRKKFNVPLSNICEMMGIHKGSLSAYVKHNKLDVGELPKGHYTWDKEGFLAWCGGAKDGAVQPSETPFEEEETDDIREEEPEINVPEFTEEDFEKMFDDTAVKASEEAIAAWNNTLGNYKPIEEVLAVHCDETKTVVTVVPCNGEMTFQGNVDDILRTISKLLDGRQVRLEVEWEVMG